MAKKVGNTYFFTGKGKSSGGGGGGGDAVLYTEQTLTESEQMQARKNQGLYYSEETPAGVITWDGDTTGKEVVEGDYIFCKVSTDAPLMESVRTFGRVRDGEESIQDIEDEDTTPIDGGYVINNGIIIVITESEATIQGLSLSKGVWFRTEGNRFVSKLTYDAYETIHHIEPKYIKDMYYEETTEEEKTVFTPDDPDYEWQYPDNYWAYGGVNFGWISEDTPAQEDIVSIKFTDSEDSIQGSELSSTIIAPEDTEGGPIILYEVNNSDSARKKFFVVTDDAYLGGYELKKGIYVPNLASYTDPYLEKINYNSTTTTVHQIPQKYLPDSGVPQLILIDDGGGSNYEVKYFGSMYKEEMTNQVSTLKLGWTIPPQTTQDDWLDCRLISGTNVASIYPEKQGMTVAIASGNNAGIGIYLLEYVVYHTGEERYEHYSMIMAIKVNEGE